jgi:hypothetical protein
MMKVLGLTGEDVDVDLRNGRVKFTTTDFLRPLSAGRAAKLETLVDTLEWKQIGLREGRGRFAEVKHKPVVPQCFLQRPRPRGRKGHRCIYR